MLSPSNFAVVLLFDLCNRYFASSKCPPFPPGPPKGLLTGHTLNIPFKKPWLTYSDWAKEYGSYELALIGLILTQNKPQVHCWGLRIAGEGDVVIISSLQAARDLLEKHGQIYSDRPFSMMDDLWVTLTPTMFTHLISHLRTQRRVAI